MKPFLFTLLTLVLFSCESSSNDAQKSNNVEDQAIQTAISDLPDYPFHYDLNKPDESFKLSKDLVEISGLSLGNDNRYLLAINDEQGKVFFIDKSDGEIKEDIKFGKSADYEGLELVDDILYVVRNSGTIVEVKNLDTDEQEEETYNTKLNAENDVEGLGYDPKHHRLLLACKGKAGEGEQFRQTKAVYGFDLNKKELIEDPIWIIDRKEIRAIAEKRGKKVPKLIELLNEDSSPAAFAPSGIAVHPISHDIYLISSVGKVLVVIKPNGKIAHLEKLDEGIFRQPEGICFEKDGTMYISSEGKGGKGRIFRFVAKS